MQSRVASVISRRQPCIPVTYVVLTSNAELGGGLEFTLWHCAFLLFWASLCPACPVCCSRSSRRAHRGGTTFLASRRRAGVGAGSPCRWCPVCVRLRSVPCRPCQVSGSALKTVLWGKWRQGLSKLEIPTVAFGQVIFLSSLSPLIDSVFCWYV